MADRPVIDEEKLATQDGEITPEMLAAGVLVDEVAIRVGEWFGPRCEGNLTMEGLRVIAADVVGLFFQRTDRLSGRGQ
jgi:hypothetical protein